MVKYSAKLQSTGAQMLIYYMSLFIAICIGIVGQISIKTGSLSTAGSTSFFMLFQPYIIFGLFCYFISALFYMYSLKQLPLSVAFPCVSLSYVVVAVISHFLWNEPFGLQHGMALLFIVSGVLLLINA